MKKKGFTMVELLAVIVIIAIIALISTPYIIQYLKTAKRQSVVNSTQDAIKDAQARCLEGNCYFVVEDSKLYEADSSFQRGEYISTSGGTGEHGKIYIDPSGVGIAAVHNAEYCAYKNSGDKIVSAKEYKDTCDLDLSITASCFDFDKSSGTITGYHKEDSNCPMDITIPDMIDGVQVKKIGDQAFILTDASGNPVEGQRPVTSVVFPKYLEEIGENAFYGAFDNGSESVYFNRITSLDFSKATNLKEIYSDAFANNLLTEFDFSKNTKLEYLGTNAFYSELYTKEVTFSGSSLPEIFWPFHFYENCGDPGYTNVHVKKQGKTKQQIDQWMESEFGGYAGEVQFATETNEEFQYRVRNNCAT